MLTDQDTDFLYLSDQLRCREQFWARLVDILRTNCVPFDVLPGTSDIWCVDYMPVQVAPESFIQFQYSPDYLQDAEWVGTITDGATVSASIGIRTCNSKLIVDGGNVIRGRDWVILTDKVFLENPKYGRKVVISMLETELEARPIIIPRDPCDFTGHADGMVRFYHDDAVLINGYKKSSRPRFHQKMIEVLRREGLETIEIPFNCSCNDSYDSAVGLYINYLQMDGFILLPAFGLPEDEKIWRFFEELFPGTTLASIDATEIAREGGVLNCITWNVKS